MYVADGFEAMMRRTGEVPLTGPPFDTFARDVLKMELEREREKPERAVLESFGKEGLADYRKMKNIEREQLVNAALLLKFIGSTSWCFGTLTPENIR